MASKILKFAVFLYDKEGRIKKILRTRRAFQVIFFKCFKWFSFKQIKSFFLKGTSWDLKKAKLHTLNF